MNFKELHNSRRWWIIIVVEMTYMCTQNSYLASIVISLILDLCVNGVIFFVSEDVRQKHRWRWFFIDLLLRMMTIWVMATIAALISYVLDLTGILGQVWLYMGINFGVLFLIWIIDSITFGAFIKIHYLTFVFVAVFTAMFVNLMTFAEPWTYGVFFLFSTSVLLLVIASEYIRWWAFFVFVVVWSWVLLISAIIIMNMGEGFERKHTLTSFFTKINFSF